MAHSPYNFSTEPTGTHALLLNEVSPQSRVLDVGCASGYLGEYLITKKQCEVWGIEPHKESAENARKYYAKVIINSIEQALEDALLVNERFDTILLGDVLEHVLRPDEVLQKLKKFLTPNGYFVISLPNVAHYAIRRALLCGNWNMTDSGILDRTHLHFYTLKTARELLQSQNFIIEKWHARGDLERWFTKLGVGKIGRILTSWFPGLFSIQFIFVAKQTNL